MQSNDKIAAWLICEDLLVKIKTELANEAIIILQNEVRSGRMKVDGKLVSQIEAQNDAERDLFVANEIAKESERMLTDYQHYIAQKENNPEHLRSKDVEDIEKAKKLMLAVHEITILINYRTVAEEWILEIEGIPQIDDPVTLLAHTIHGKEDERFAVLELASKRKSFKQEEVFTNEERGMIDSAIGMVENKRD